MFEKFNPYIFSCHHQSTSHPTADKRLHPSQHPRLASSPFTATGREGSVVQEALPVQRVLQELLHQVEPEAAPEGSRRVEGFQVCRVRQGVQQQYFAEEPHAHPYRGETV